ncbi:hypothetical protein [uncultured Pelagimonas sp.]|uniref:hypothetical protein n=1 Tax=uncultured Pelagimonas sp. TaxID=1618102 RepID=UPI0026314929|nr:hypothetical protein [uncultured Pelagimonas sp.]
MTRVLAFLLLFFGLMSSPLWAQNTPGDPQITVTFDAQETLVGQPITVRVKILVPTWLTTPVSFSSLEQPSLLARLPSRATTPISERINGETWSGVSRRYMLYPLASGTFELPASDIVVSYAQPGQSDPILFKTTLPKASFKATVPEEARLLSPLIIARDFALEQVIEGGPTLAIGDAITRTVTAKIDGTTSILIPQLFEPIETEALRGYPKDPVVTESEDRDGLSGTRVETITYVALAGGDASLPEVSVDWYNLDSGKVETAELPGQDITVTGAPPPKQDPIDAEQIGIWLGSALIVLTLLSLIWKNLWPRLKAILAIWMAKWRASEPAAHRALKHALKTRDLSQVLAAYNDWKTFFPTAKPSEFEGLETALSSIGAARYSPQADQNTGMIWQQIGAHYKLTRSRLILAQKQQQNRHILPPLNP